MKWEEGIKDFCILRYMVVSGKGDWGELNYELAFYLQELLDSYT